MDGSCAHYMSAPRTGRCSKPECELPRCPLCLKNLVSRRGQVCIDCLSESKCDQCGTKGPTTLMNVRYKKFLHLTIGTCGSCMEPDVKISAEGLCYQCTNFSVEKRKLCEACAFAAEVVCVECNMLTLVTNSKGQCIPCAYGGTWKAFSNDFRLRRCIWCAEMRTVNGDGVCRDCYAEEKATNAGYKVARCESCSAFMPHGSGQYCDKCVRSSSTCSCGRGYIKTTPDQKMCEVCLGICRKCHVNPVKYSDLCEECSRTEAKPWK